MRIATSLSMFYLHGSYWGHVLCTHTLDVLHAKHGEWPGHKTEAQAT